MPYKCGFGCTSFNPLCDACDSATTSDSPYFAEKEDHILHKAALHGQTKKEYLEDEDKDEKQYGGWGG